MSEYEYEYSQAGISEAGALGSIALFGEAMSSENLRTYRDEHAAQLDILNRLVVMDDKLYLIMEMLRGIQAEQASKRQELPVVRPLNSPRGENISPGDPEAQR